MAGNSTYCYRKDSVDFVIENGVLKGASKPLATKYNNYGQEILERLRTNPDFIGQIDGVTGRKETFAEMMEKSVKCALWMKKQNVQGGDVIGICTHNQMDMYIPLLASFYIGAVFNAWWENRPTKEIVRHFLTLTRPKIVFIHEASLAIAVEASKELETRTKFITFGNCDGFESLENILSMQDTRLVNKFHCSNSVGLDDPAFLIYTSGSTGLPKIIVTSHKGIFGNSKNFIKLGRSKERMNSMNFSSLSWGVGIASLLRALVVPETRIIYPDYDPEKGLELIEKYKVNLLHLPPNRAHDFQRAAEKSSRDLSSLKLFWISGGVVHQAVQNAIATSFSHAKVYQAYGTSELGGIALRQNPGFKQNSCGTIVDNVMMKIVDPVSRRILGPNEPGEACFKSPFMMTHYHENPEETRKTIDPEGWLHSGDLVHYDEEGHVFVTDRVSEMINYRGQYISPETVEQIMQMHPDVADIAVVSIPHEEDGQHPIAFIRKTRESKVTGVELAKFMNDAISNDLKISGTVKFINEVPRLLSGKIARAYLKKLARCDGC